MNSVYNESSVLLRNRKLCLSCSSCSSLFFVVSLNEDISCISVEDCNLVYVHCAQLKVLWSETVKTCTRFCIGVSLSDVIWKHISSAIEFFFFNLNFLGFYSTSLSGSASPYLYPLLYGVTFVSYPTFLWMFIDFFPKTNFSTNFSLL